MVGGTLLLDEADFDKTGVGSDITKILNSGYQKGTPVIKHEKDALGNFVPARFDAFGPKIINGRSPFKDDATETRCLTLVPIATNRKDVPKQLPAEFHSEAEEIRNQLLAWRLAWLERVPKHELEIPGLNPRANQLTHPFLAVLSTFDSTESQETEAFFGALVRFMQERQVKLDSQNSASVEAALAWGYGEALRENKAQPTVNQVAGEAKGRMMGADPRVVSWLTARKAGEMLRGLGFSTENRSKKGHLVSIDLDRLAGLEKQFGLTQSTPLEEECQCT